MSLVDVFKASYGQHFPILQALAVFADETEKQMERFRVHFGFQQDWSPYYNRRMSAGTSDAIKWKDKLQAMNGPGDVWNFLGELCAWADIIQEKANEIEAKSIQLADKVEEQVLVNRKLTPKKKLIPGKIREAAKAAAAEKAI